MRLRVVNNSLLQAGCMRALAFSHNTHTHKRSGELAVNSQVKFCGQSVCQPQHTGLSAGLGKRERARETVGQRRRKFAACLACVRRVWPAIALFFVVGVVFLRAICCLNPVKKQLCWGGKTAATVRQCCNRIIETGYEGGERKISTIQCG